MTKLWRGLVNWFENGDLLPLIIIVSVPHYGHVLANYDFWPVAAVIGALVDLGHYRTIKAFLAGKGGAWMVVMTVFSLGFHWSFYVTGGAGLWAGLFFAAAVPVVIFALSFIAKSERLAEKAARGVAPAVKVVTPDDTPKLTSDTPPVPQLTAGAPLSRVDQYAAENGVSRRTAYRHLKRQDAEASQSQNGVAH